MPTDIEEVNTLVVGDTLEGFGGRGDIHTRSVIRAERSRKNSQKQDLCRGHRFSQSAHNLAHPDGGGWRIATAMADVVGADHHHGNLGM